MRGIIVVGCQAILLLCLDGAFTNSGDKETFQVAFRRKGLSSVCCKARAACAEG
jgi:hypothetical protein